MTLKEENIYLRGVVTGLTGTEIITGHPSTFKRKEITWDENARRLYERLKALHDAKRRK